MRIDAHQHFWNYDAQTHAWIDDSMQVIRRSFGPGDLEPLLRAHDMDGCVAVQVQHSEAETQEFLQMAEAHPFIRGVVGWTDLSAPGIGERLAYWAQFPRLKGFRHLVQGEADDRFLYRPAFREGIGLLERYNFTYDILIYPHQMPMATDFAAAFPHQRFVLDHLAKPYIKKGLIDEWKRDLRAMAALDNVWCKVSGLVTEAEWGKHHPADFRPYIDAAREAFGTDRLLFGSDWPVCLLSASYDEVLAIAEAAFGEVSPEERAALFGGNAARFYRLGPS
ncbi:MAG TPA: amidohydrolase family protein [Chitinophagaceae bacterium]|jgi:L-fuconolactonase|nr:amidohydrolase family protein [Chitinophagaceae bacterium]